jgi:hypothetical protein
VASARVILSAALLISSACRTQPYDDRGSVGASDFPKAADLAAPADLASPDLAHDDCPPESQLVYVIDAHTKMLSSFRPDTLAFTDVKTLDCPAQLGFAPWSMAVQRDGTGWVEYAHTTYSTRPSEVFRIVSVRTGECDPTPHVLSAGAPTYFGMAIALDAGTETLYIEGPINATTTSSVLGTLDRDTFAFTLRGPIDGDGDLTSDADGHLYAFFPDWNKMVAKVEDLDKSSGAALRTWPLPMVDSYMGGVAIAYWGGSFWLFAGMGPGDGTTTLLRVDPATGNLTTAIADTGRHVIGAGVAPCKHSQ